jgi:hypothetical protein
MDGFLNRDYKRLRDKGQGTQGKLGARAPAQHRRFYHSLMWPIVICYLTFCGIYAISFSEVTLRGEILEAQKARANATNATYNATTNVSSAMFFGGDSMYQYTIKAQLRFFELFAYSLMFSFFLTSPFLSFLYCGVGPYLMNRCSRHLTIITWTVAGLGTILAMAPFDPLLSMVPYRHSQDMAQLHGEGGHSSVTSRRGDRRTSNSSAAPETSLQTVAGGGALLSPSGSAGLHDTDTDSTTVYAVVPRGLPVHGKLAQMRFRAVMRPGATAHMLSVAAAEVIQSAWRQYRVESFLIQENSLALGKLQVGGLQMALAICTASPLRLHFAIRLVQAAWRARRIARAFLRYVLEQLKHPLFLLPLTSNTGVKAAPSKRLLLGVDTPSSSVPSSVAADASSLSFQTLAASRVTLTSKLTAANPGAEGGSPFGLLTISWSNFKRATGSRQLQRADARLDHLETRVDVGTPIFGTSHDHKLEESKSVAEPIDSLDLHIDGKKNKKKTKKQKHKTGGRHKLQSAYFLNIHQKRKHANHAWQAPLGSEVLVVYEETPPRIIHRQGPAAEHVSPQARAAPGGPRSASTENTFVIPSQLRYVTHFYVASASGDLRVLLNRGNENRWDYLRRHRRSILELSRGEGKGAAGSIPSLERRKTAYCVRLMDLHENRTISESWARWADEGTAGRSNVGATLDSVAEEARVPEHVRPKSVVRHRPRPESVDALQNGEGAGAVSSVGGRAGAAAQDGVRDVEDIRLGELTSNMDRTDCADDELKHDDETRKTELDDDEGILFGLDETKEKQSPWAFRANSLDASSSSVRKGSGPALDEEEWL